MVVNITRTKSIFWSQNNYITYSIRSDQTDNAANVRSQAIRMEYLYKVMNTLTDTLLN